MSATCFSLLELLCDAIAASISFVTLRKTADTIGQQLDEHSETQATIPRLCAVMSADAEQSIVINDLKLRGFIVMAIITDKMPLSESNDTYLLKVGPKLFPKLAVGLNMPLQPIAKYSQGDLYRIYEAAMMSVSRSKRMNVLYCYLQHDPLVLEKCLKYKKTSDIIDYFGLSFGLLHEYTISYVHKLIPIALIAFMALFVSLFQYLTTQSCPVLTSSLIPILIVFWSFVSLFFWRQRALALISTMYSGLMLSLIGGNSSSLVRLQIKHVLILLGSVLYSFALAAVYIYIHGILKSKSNNTAWLYLWATLYSVVPKLLTTFFHYILKKVDKKSDSSGNRSTCHLSPASSCFAFEIVNHTVALCYFHFGENDYQSVRILLMSKLIFEQIIEYMLYYVANKRLFQFREKAHGNFAIAEVSNATEDTPGANRMRKNSGTFEQRLRSNSFTVDDYSLTESKVSRALSMPDDESRIAPTISNSEVSNAGGKLKGVKGFFKKIGRKKQKNANVVDDDMSETTADYTDIMHVGSPEMRNSSHGDLEKITALRAGLTVDVSEKATSNGPNTQLAPEHSSPPPSTRVVPVLSMSELLTDFLKHPTNEV